MNFLSKLREQDGATATEYLFLLVFIALVIAGAAFALGGALDTAFGGATTAVEEAPADPGA